MERKLAEYRAKKAKEFKNRDNITEEDEDTTFNNKNSEEDARIWSSSDTQGAESNLGRVGRMFQKLYSINGILKATLWFTLWMFFIKIEFGAVYFAVSLTIILYYSMAYNTRGKDELSAYSVFNKNFERLDGTFTAEQFDNQIRRGGGLAGSS